LGVTNKKVTAHGKVISGSTMSYTSKALSSEEVKAMFDTKKVADRKKVLQTFAKLAKSKRWLIENCDLGAISGHKISPDWCVEVPTLLMLAIMHDFVDICVAGTKVNGKTNNWSNGGFGSQWMDMDASKYGLDYIRCAFYAKETTAEWGLTEKPYMVRITIEKSKE